MGEIVAGVTLMQDFCRPWSDVFKAYIDYMDRDEAQRNRAISAYNLYHDYMGNPEKTTGLFTSDKDRLTYAEKRELKEIFQEAQANESMMWQTVVSFDNRWLENNGLYDSKRRILNEKKIHEVTRNAINKMLEKEGLECAVWTAAIHYNTDNIHVHVATVEPIPMRQKTLYNGKLENRGKFKLKNLESCKSSIVNEIMQTKEMNLRINKIIREEIVKMKEERKVMEDPEIREKFLELYKNLPFQNVSKNLFHYNNGIMTQFHSQIDEISDIYLNKYHKQEFDELKKILKKQSDLYSQAYGRYDRKYEETKIRDLYERLGNAILKEVLSYDQAINKRNDKEIRTREKQHLSTSVPPNAAREVSTWNVENKLQMIQESAGIDLGEKDRLQEREQKDQKMFAAVVHEKELNSEKFDLKLQRNTAPRKLNEELQRELAEAERALFGRREKVALNGNDYVSGIKKSKDIEIDEPGTEAPVSDKKYKEWMKRFREAKKAINRAEMGKIDENSVKALIDAEVAARNPFLLHLKAEMLLNGQIFEMDQEKAKQYFLDAFRIFRKDELTLGAVSGNGEKNIGFNIHAYVQYRIGKQLNRGWGVDKDCKEAAKWYEKSGESYAKYALGNLYFYGEGVEKDYERAFSYYIDSGENAYALLKCAEMLKKGLGCEPSLEQSEKYYKRAFEKFEQMVFEAKQTDGMAEYELGRMLYAGEGCERDVQKSIEYLEASVQKKNTYAQYLVSVIYIENEMEEKIPDAIKMLTQLAEQGDLDNAQYALGKLYTNLGQKFYDLEKGIYFLQKSAGQENEYAQYLLGKLYTDADLEIYDLKKGIHYLELSAEQENEYAQYWLGKLYTNTALEIYDLEKGIDYLISSAKQKNQYAQYLLGKLYTDADLEIYDLKKGIHYLEMSAEQGNSYAQYWLGKLYMDSGLEIYDPKRGCQYLEPLAEQGFEYAKYILGVKYLDKKCEIHDPEKGLAYIKELAEAGNEYAQTKLGCEYLKGENVERNIYQARQWLWKASEQGDVLAKTILCDIQDSGYERRRGGSLRELDKALCKLQRSMDQEHSYTYRILKQYEMEQDWELEQMEEVPPGL